MNRRKIELIIKALLLFIYIVCGWAAVLDEQWGRVVIIIIGIILTVFGI